VRGRRETHRTPALLVLAGLAVGLALPGVGGADPAQQANALRHQQDRLSASSNAALLSLYALDSQLTRARSRLAALQSQAQALRAAQAEAKQEAAIAEDAWRKSVSALADHLRALYEQGEPDSIAVLLGATSVDDAMTQLDALERSARLNRLTIEQARVAERSLAHLRQMLELRSREVQQNLVQAEQTAAALAQARTQRVAYISALALERALNNRTIARLEVAAQRITARSQVVTAQQTGDPASGPTAQVPLPTTISGQQLTVTATGYSLMGHTATGMPVGWGVVAVDPSVIPLGTQMSIPGYGEGVAADTGGAVRGAVIDLWFPTLGQARAWGRRTVTISLH
jgi:3D (Asp-Asp-Asp) domain-containing protein/peptidoglycan hydrolase CwlO-like protein